MHIEPATSPHEMLQTTVTLVDTLDALGRSDALPEVRALLPRALELSAARLGSRDYPAQRAALVQRLADGELTLDDAVTAAVDLERRADADGAAPRLVREASGVVIRRMWELVKAPGDRYVTDLFRPIVDRVLEDVTTAADRIPADVGSDAAAMRSSAAVVTAWKRLNDARTTWDRVHALADQLRHDGVIPVRRDNDYRTVDFRFRRPDARPNHRAAHRHRALVLPADLAAGAAPTILTVDEVEAYRHGGRWALEHDGEAVPA